MATRARRYTRNLVIALALLAVGGWLGPRFLGAEGYRVRLRNALERALGRPVSFGSISLHLLPHPGFTVENVVVGELPKYGSEPFGRAARLDCDLRWRSFWRARMSIASLTLEDVSLNLVRDPAGQWNIEGMLVKSSSAARDTPSANAGERPLGIDVLVRDARLNFKVGEDKKPFALTNVEGSVHIDIASNRINFHLSGSPMRTDLSYPTPGTIEFAGVWAPAGVPGGELDASVRTRGTLLYDWIPLLAGSNAGIYGVLDSDIRMTGSLRDPKFEGVARLTQVHRWDALPPASSLPCALHFRGDFDRDGGQIRLAGLDFNFGESQIHLAGTVSEIPSNVDLDLVVGIERSRVDDFADLYQHLTGREVRTDITGRVDGLLTVQGAWRNPRYGGFVSARNVKLTTPLGTYPVSEIALRIEDHRGSLAPARVQLAPHVEAVVAGQVELFPQAGEKSLPFSPVSYGLTLQTYAVPLHALIRFAQGVGVDEARNLDGRGIVTLTLRAAGTLWPSTPPDVSGHATLQRAQLFIPGLTEPLNVPRAEVRVEDSGIVVSPFVAVLGTSVFTGSIQHLGPRREPWKFDLTADHLDIGQSAAWFDVLGEQQPVPLLQNLPGIGSLVERRQAASSLFDRLNAVGKFSAAAVQYRALTLHNLTAAVVVHDRLVQISPAKFRAGGGWGSGDAAIDLADKPAALQANLSVVGARISEIASGLPASMKQARGVYSLRGHFETRGLSRTEISANLSGAGTIQLRKVMLGNFDLLRSIARETGEQGLAIAGLPSTIESGSARFVVGSGRIELQQALLNLGSARVDLTGSTYGFDGAVRVNVQADMRRSAGLWAAGGKVDAGGLRLAKLEFTGTFDHLVRIPQVRQRHYRR